MEHVPPEVFGEDYLFFYEGFLGDEASDGQVEAIWTVLGLEPGVEVLDVPCGHGRIANRLVLNWFTSFGYFDDDGNRAWLREARKTLRSGGRLVLDVHNRDAFARNWLPVTLSERDGDLLVDRHRFDLVSGRNETDRFLVRDGRVRRADYSVRFFTFTELRDWLVDAGFSAVEVSGHEGEPLTLQVRRMLVVATR